MKLAISNIAWKQHDDPFVLDLLRKYKVAGIEIAPTKIWPQWNNAGHLEAEKYKVFLKNEGFSIPAMQAILFGRPELQVFDPQTHPAFLDHFKRLADIASGFDAQVLVFGSPKNRKRGQLSMEEAIKVAADLFFQIGHICQAHHCCIGWEPNPVEYGCDFITNVADAAVLIKAINHPAVKLHLDAAGLHLCGGRIADQIERAGSFCHYHISEPMLKPIVLPVVNHAEALTALKKTGYSNWVSIEMEQTPNPVLNTVLEYIQKLMEETGFH